MKKTYAEKLRDPRWQKRRLEILEKSDFTCMKCDSADKELHVHHLLYERKKEPWEYEDKLLLPLCKDCHETVADTQADITKLLAEFPPDFLGDLHMALCDILGGCHVEHPFIVWDEWIKAARPKSQLDPDIYLWRKVVQEVRSRRPLIRCYVEAVKGVGADDEFFYLAFPSEQKMAMDSLSSPRTRKFLENLFEEIGGRTLKLKCSVLEQQQGEEVRN